MAGCEHTPFLRQNLNPDRVVFVEVRERMVAQLPLCGREATPPFQPSIVPATAMPSHQAPPREGGQRLLTYLALCPSFLIALLQNLGWAK